MSLLQSLVDRTRTYTRDDGGGYITDTDIIAWLNEAVADLGARLQLFEQETSTTTSGSSLSLPTTPELVEIQDCLLGTTNHVRFVSADEWDANVDSATTPSNTLAQIFDDHIEFYPTPKAGTAVKLRYKRLPTALVNGQDTVEMPRHLERKMVEYAASRARYKDGDFDGGNNWNQLYEKGLPGVSDGRERFFTQDLALQRSANVFDSSSYRSHI